MATRSSDGSTVSLSVQSGLPEGHPQGSFNVRIAQTASAHQLLRTLCKQAIVPLLPSYGLQTADGVDIPSNKTLASLEGLQAEDALMWVITDNPSITGCKCWNVYWFMALLCLLIAVAGLITVSYIHVQEEQNLQYAIIFDAGSSHTAMYIYKWEGEKINSTAVAIQDGARCNSEGKGIASYGNRTSEAGQSLEECLQKAAGRIPSNKHTSSSVYLGATAGMRLLQKSNSTASDAIMKSVRETISSYDFKFADPERQARIIRGSEEGAFSWITSNYVTGTFDVHPPRDGVVPELFVSSVGTLDLGGASTQITFVANTSAVILEDDHFVTDLYGANYSMYTHSYLCYGINEAVKRLQAAVVEAANYSSVVKNPCSPEGYVLNITRQDLFQSPCVSGEDAVLHFGRAILPSVEPDQGTVFSLQGESNATACRAIVKEHLFNLTAPCPQACPRCSFNGVCQPPVYGDFYGISSYFYVTEFLNLTSPSDAINHTDFTAATQSLCAKSWEEVKKMKTKSPPALPWYCFESIYIDTLLVDGYGFDPNSTWDAIHFVGSVGWVDVGWTLGFIINESNTLPSTSVGHTFSTVAFVLLICLFIGFFLLFLCFARLALGRCRFRNRSFFADYHGYGAI